MTTTTKPQSKRGTQGPSKPDGSSLDPRIAERRRDVQRGAGRRRLHTLIALAVITLTAIASLAILQSSWMDIDVLVVDGTEHTAAVDVERASGIELGSPLVDLDARAAERGIRLLPWVADAQVARAWNGTITMTVTERVPAVALPTVDGAVADGAVADGAVADGAVADGAVADGYMLIDAAGRQLEPVAERPFGFVPIAGLLASGEPGQPAPPEIHGIIRLLGLLAPERLAEIDQVVVRERNLYLQLKQQGRVRLGNDSGLAEKLVSLDTILSTVDLRCLWEIDVRVHTAPAITRLSASGQSGAPLADLSTCT